MKKLGIIGGLGPASTTDYYMEIIKGYRAKTGTDDYPEIIINSLNMREVLAIVANEDWEKLVNIFLQAIETLNSAGADFAAIASNTPHIVFDTLRQRSPLPLISIVEETCRYAKHMAYQKVLVIGTLFTMKSGMYTGAFLKYGIAAQVPPEKEQETLYSLFYPDLENGIVIPENKAKMINLLRGMIKGEPFDALVLGCTELPMMIKANDIDLPLINTTEIHINAIVDYYGGN